MTTKKIGLLLSDEDDWPVAFEQLHARFKPNFAYHGATLTTEVERIRIHPFNLRAPTTYDLVIDRLAYWHFHPREWLKKAVLVNNVYALNNPFTFQSMEKHSAYCAMIRLGLHIPETWLIPAKTGPDTEKYRRTTARYHDWFDLPGIAEQVGYPLYMKPFDGGGWRGVSRVEDSDGLHRAYDESGEMLMHLQATVDFESFARALSIGPETMVMDFRPDEPMHSRYHISHDFLSPSSGHQAAAISRIVNAFFKWEFNSAEMLVRGDEVYPIDYANACPDVAITSLHYYFPWAITALVKWSVFCLVTGRRGHVDLRTTKFFAIADNPDMTYDDKLAGYLALAEDYFESQRYADFVARNLGYLDERVLDWVCGPDFDDLIVSTVKATYPEHEWEKFIAHFRGLTGIWATDHARTPYASAG